MFGNWETATWKPDALSIAGVGSKSAAGSTVSKFGVEAHDEDLDAAPGKNPFRISF